MSPATVNCPTCGRALEWSDAPFRPFCSERCRLIDLGAWLTEQRALPGDASVREEQEAPPPEGPEKPPRS
jgi:endogenous inhibitor of DNA gyrase (YacG/DUF329 family)